MIRRCLPVRRRRGTATVEFALVMNVIVLPLILGLWEMGRYVQVQQIVANAAREGARMAAQAMTIEDTGNTTQITTSQAPNLKKANVKGAVMQYLAGAGLTNVKYSDVDVTFSFQPAQTGDPALVGTVGTTQPYEGVQNQRFRVTVTITDETSPGVLKSPGNRPLRERILWTTLGFVQPNTVSYQVDWVILVDRPFTVNATVPNW